VLGALQELDDVLGALQELDVVLRRLDELDRLFARGPCNGGTPNGCDMLFPLA